MSSGKCPRCGGKSVGGTSGSRCAACLKKLAKERKTPGNKQRGWKVANDSKRREDGQTAKAKKKTSGTGNTKTTAKNLIAAEKRTGQKLSPNRKSNSKGYSSKNVEYVPIPLNRGRHDIDHKKLSAWHKSVKGKLKKSQITEDELAALTVANIHSKEKYRDLRGIVDQLDLDFVKNLLKNG